MNSLKDKFEKFSEEPQHSSWEKMLKRLDAEMPAGRGKRFRFWFLPVFLITICATWGALALFHDSDAQSNRVPAPAVISQGQYQNSTVTMPANSQSGQYHETASSGSTTEQVVQPPVQPAASHSFHQNESPSVDPVIPANPANNPDQPATVVPEPAQNETGIKNNAETLNKLNYRGQIPPALFYPVINAGSEVAVRSRKEYQRFVLEIFYGAGFSNMIFKAPEHNLMGSRVIRDGLALRKAITAPGYSFSTGTNVKYFITPGIQIETGYHLTQQTQNLYYSVDSVCGCYLGLDQIGANNEQLNSTAHDSISRPGKSIHSFTNRFYIREIPVILTYNIPDRRFGAISYKLSLGFTYMHFTSVNSRMPDADQVGFVETKGTNEFPNYRNSFSSLIGTGIIYHGGYNVDWSLSPQLKIAMRSISTNQYWMQEYPWQFQLGFGVGHRF